MKKILFLGLIFIYALSSAQVQYGVGSPVTSIVNSSVATLTSGSTFTGTSEDVSRFVEIRVSVISDVASATDGLSMQQSKDGTNWDFVNPYTIPAAIGKEFGIGRSTQFFRVVYTNGGTNQTSFRLVTTYLTSRSKPSSVRPQDARSNDNDMEENLSYQMIYDPIANVWNRQINSEPITGASAQTATVNNIIPTASGSTGTNVAPFVFGSIQVVSTGTAGTFIFESSNSDANYTTMNVWNNTVLTGTPITAAITASSSNITYYFPITSNFIRLRIASTITGGSIQAFTKLNTTSPFPVAFQVAQNTAANLNATVVVGSGTLTGVTTLTTANGGPTAASAASANNPNQVGGVVVPTTIATQDQTFVAGDVVKLPVSTGAQVITKPFSTPEIDWFYAPPTSGISNTTTAVTFKAASGTAGIRTYLTGCQISATALGAATELAIRDGAAGTVIWRIQIPAGGLSTTNFDFPNPIKGTANTLMEVVTLTASVTGSVYVNCQGYTGF